MPLRYRSGEEVLGGDRIIYHFECGKVEFVASPGDPETAWYVQEFGGGCMIQVPSFGRVFLTSTHDDEDFGFVSRRDA